MRAHAGVLAGEDVRGALLNGMLRAVNVLAATYGPRGRLVVLENPVGDPFGVTPPTLTRDGATVLDECEFGTPPERLGVHLLQQAVGELGAAHGDSTTTAALVCGTLALAALRLQAQGLAAEELAESVEAGVRQALTRLAEQARVADEGQLAAMAARLAPSPKVALALLDAVEAADGGPIEVDVVETPADVIEVERREGLEWPFAAADDSLTAEGEMLLAIFDQELGRGEELVPALEAAYRCDRGLAVIAPGYSEDVRVLLERNRRRLPLAAYTAPAEATWRRLRLDDLSAATGADVLSPGDGQSVANRLASVLVARDRAGVRLLPAGAANPAALKRRRWLQQAHADAAPGFERDRLRDRLRLFQSGARITVGARTLVLAKHRRKLLQNGLSSLCAARAGGVVPGGGAALHYAVPAASVAPVEQALRAPLRALLASIDVEPASVLALLEAPEAFDIRLRAPIDAWDAGLLDPLAPLEDALHKAASLTRLLLRTQLAIVGRD